MSKLKVGTEQITIHVASEATGGALLAAEVELPPGGGPPAMHRHAPEELYRVERGVLAFYVEDDRGEVSRIEAGRGEIVHIPGGRAHTVRNESVALALAYVVFSPGAEMERFVRAAAELTACGQPPIEHVLALASRHGIAMAGPVPSG